MSLVVEAGGVRERAPDRQIVLVRKPRQRPSRIYGRISRHEEQRLLSWTAALFGGAAVDVLEGPRDAGHGEDTLDGVASVHE